MTRLSDLQRDIDIALRDVGSAADTDSRRRAVIAAMNLLYMLRAHREGPQKTPERAAYYIRARSTDGQVAETVVWLRGKSVHDLVAEVDAVVQPLYPGQVYPGTHTSPGANLVWLDSSQLTVPIVSSRDQTMFRLYRKYLANRPVLAALHLARDFWFSDPGPSI